MFDEIVQEVNTSAKTDATKFDKEFQFVASIFLNWNHYHNYFYYEDFKNAETALEEIVKKISENNIIVGLVNIPIQGKNCLAGMQIFIYYKKR